jgi:hypothetical protein
VKGNVEIISSVVIPAIALIITAIGGWITICTYKKNSNIRRAEWLYSLFEKFFCQANYAEIRQLLDYDNKEQIIRLQKAVKMHSDAFLEEKLIDYLNFFEFIASLWRLKQLSLKEIRMMFDYYIRRLGDYDFIMEYLNQEGFEGLVDLIKEVRK